MHNHETDKALITHEEHNKVIRQEIGEIYTRHKWIYPLVRINNSSVKA